MQILRFVMSALPCALIAFTLHAMEYTKSAGNESPEIVDRKDQAGRRALGASREGLFSANPTDDKKTSAVKAAEGAQVGAALTQQAEQSMEHRAPTAAKEEAAPKAMPWSKTLQKYLHTKPLLLQLAALFADDGAADDEEGPQLDRRAVMKLCLHAKIDALLELLAFDPAIVKKYINLKTLKNYFTHCTEENSNNKLKVHALKKSFKQNLWSDVFRCEELGKAVHLIIDLFYYTGTDEEKQEMLGELKKTLATVKEVAAAQDKHQPLNSYLNIDEIISIVDDALEKKHIEPARLARALNGEALVRHVPERVAPLRDSCSPNNLLSLVAVALLLDKPSEKLTLFELLSCFKLDELVCSMPKALGLADNALELLFDVPHLKKALQKFQEGTELNAQDLKLAINKAALEEFSISVDTVAQWFDFETMADRLNKWRRGELEKGNGKGQNNALKELGDAFGIDLAGAINPRIPEAIQQQKIEQIIERATSPTWSMRLAYGLPFFAAAYVTHYAGHALCHSCMEVFEPQRWWTAGLMTAASLMVALKGSELCEGLFANPSSLKKLVVNGAVSMGLTKLTRIADRWQRSATEGETLCKDIPQGHPREALFKAFCGSLTHDHFQKLGLVEHEAVLQLLDNPQGFITNKAHEDFIIGLCTIAPERADERIEALLGILRSAQDAERLPHYESYSLFKNFLAAGVGIKKPESTLANRRLLELGLYCPRLLLTQHDFLRAIQYYNIAHKNLMALLLTAIQAAN